MLRAIIMIIILLMASNITYASIIPKSLSSKNVYVRSRGEVRYTSVYKLGQIVNMLNDGATSSHREFMVSKSGSYYLLDYYGNNRTNFKFYIDANNFLKKVIIIKGVEEYVLDDSKPDEMVSALFFVLPFKDKLADKIEAQNKINQEKEKKFVEINMLNFDVHMPLFAGLNWGDTFANALHKIQKIPAIKELKANCSIQNYDFPAELVRRLELKGLAESQVERIVKALRDNDPISDEDAKIISEVIDNCEISGKFVLFNSEAELIVHLGHTTFGGQVPFFLNHISICGDFEANYIKLKDALNLKYVNFNEKGSSKTRKYDKFGSNVDFDAACDSGKAVEYWKSGDISDLQKKMIINDINKNKSEQLEQLPQADSAF